MYYAICYDRAVRRLGLLDHDPFDDDVRSTLAGLEGSRADGAAHTRCVRPHGPHPIVSETRNHDESQVSMSAPHVPKPASPVRPVSTRLSELLRPLQSYARESSHEPQCEEQHSQDKEGAGRLPGTTAEVVRTGFPSRREAQQEPRQMHRLPCQLLPREIRVRDQAESAPRHSSARRT
jgi:hypothetical protein